MILWSCGSGGSTSATPKAAAGVSETDAQSAEEMVNSMLLDSLLPDAEEEERRKQEEILTGKPIVPSPLNVEFFRLFGFLL